MTPPSRARKPPAAAKAKAKTAKAAPTARSVKKAAQAAADCRHPKASEVNLGYMIKCGLCNRKVR